jgi:Tfp pilus assembly protein PilV
MQFTIPFRVQRSVFCSAGFSIVEVMIAMGIGSLALGSTMLINSQQLRIVKSTRDSSAASHSMQERVEQLRIATWRQITDSSYVAGTLFATLPRSIAPLEGFHEQITVTAWPDPNACTGLIVEKSENQSAHIVSVGAGLKDQRLAKVDVQIRWMGKNSRVRSREMTTVISNGGISRMNLSAMGSMGGADWSASSGSSAGTGGSSTTTTVSPPTTPPTAVNGNGKGRGTVGGKGGQK